MRRREKVRKFINASSTKEVLFTRGTNDWTQLGGRYAEEVLKEGDEVLISIMEHHSNIIPWQQALQEDRSKTGLGLSKRWLTGYAGLKEQT